MDKRHAEVVTLADVHQHDAAMAGACVRVLGCFKHFDPVLNMAVLSYGALDLLVDTSLLGVMDRHNPKVLYQVVGDLEWLERSHRAVGTFNANIPVIGTQTVVLRAKLTRNVDGLSVPLFEKALKVRRDFTTMRANLNF
ncbi:telomere-capping, CST complex subunit-domain-containing protein [Zopfochytrium polystomum]|nr:telomere-capping, CST complex subunit-domain-containing protein [Zopfochytrium polystomum]